MIRPRSTAISMATITPITTLGMNLGSSFMISRSVGFLCIYCTYRKFLRCTGHFVALWDSSLVVPVLTGLRG